METRSTINPIFALLIALGSAGDLLSLATICPPNWHQYEESCYLLITQLTDWHQANRTCVQSRAKLAVPNSQDEQEFLWEFFLSGFDQNPTEGLWIGCNDIEVEGTWKNCPLRDDANAYQNWKDGEPSNIGDGDSADCGRIARDWGGKWGDYKCSTPKYAACERPIQKETNLFCLETDPAGRIDPACLVDHIVKELPVSGVLACGKACRWEPRCGSFNLVEMVPGKMQCQLNNATRHEAGELYMKKIQNCYFFNL